MFKPALAALTIPAVILLAACGSETESTPDAAPAGSALIDGKSVQEIVDARQAGFKKLGKAFKTISDQMRSGDADMAVIQSAAASVPEATQGIETWFPAGTGPESGVKTEALPAIWEKPEEFAEKVASFKMASAALAEVSKTGDMTAITAAFRKTGGTCKGCHDTFRLDD